jgi:hypothetical protein
VVLLWVTVELLELVAVAAPVVIDAVPVAVFAAVLVPAPPPLWSAAFDWPKKLPARLPPLFADAHWSVDTPAHWSFAENAPAPVASVTVPSWDCDTDALALFVADAAPDVTDAAPVAVLEASDVPPVPVVPSLWSSQLSCQNLLPAMLSPVFALACCEVSTPLDWLERLPVPPGLIAKADAANATVAAPAAAVPMMSLKDFKFLLLDRGGWVLRWSTEPTRAGRTGARGKPDSFPSIPRR